MFRGGKNSEQPKCHLISGYAYSSISTTISLSLCSCWEHNSQLNTMNCAATHITWSATTLKAPGGFSGGGL